MDADPPEPLPDPENDWPVAFAAALAGRGGSRTKDAEPTPAEMAAILRLAKDVAHGVERRFAPVATYLAGRFVADRLRQGATATEALAEATQAARRLIEGSRGSVPPAT